MSDPIEEHVRPRLLWAAIILVVLLAIALNLFDRHLLHDDTKPIPGENLTQWGYHRTGDDRIVIDDDTLTLKPDGTVWDSHGDYVGRLKGKP